MQIIITQPIVDALKTLHDVPDDLRVRIDAIVPVDGGFALKLSDDQGIAIGELLQWHVRTDPKTGKPTAESAPFGELIRLVDEAMF